MASEFANSVDYGFTLSKRIYYGKGSATSPPVVAPPVMNRAQEGYLPEALMVYAVVPEPEVVDNPDVPSYQPYVHGKCVPPALIPLHMHGVSVEADCCLDSAYVTVRGTWRVHCVMTSRKCDCRIAIPLPEQVPVMVLLFLFLIWGFVAVPGRGPVTQSPLVIKSLVM